MVLCSKELWMQLQMVELDEKVSDSCCKLETHALLLAGSLGCARELVQETVLCLICNNYDSRGAGNAHAWATVVMHNITKNNSRRQKLRSGDSSDTPGIPSVKNSSCDILSTIEMLPPLQAYMVKLCIAGYKKCDIARELRLPAKLVKSILHTAKDNLLVLFAQGGNK